MAPFTLQNRFLLRLYTWRKKWRPSPPFSLPVALRQTGRLLICFPDEPEEALTAVAVLPDLMDSLGAESALVIGAPSVGDRLRERPSSVETETVGPTDLSWTGFPRKELIRRISGYAPDVAIDLNPVLNPVIGVLCKLSGAPVRICFEGPQRDLFFNLQIVMTLDGQDVPATVPERSITNPYARLPNTLRRLAGHVS
ncbi:MAG: hypothetical protein FJY97_00740 [candidate division Zixibacteria bacterium]|nr:hypothetical protein [candidate division Zixibacteria bacterium]